MEPAFDPSPSVRSHRNQIRFKSLDRSSDLAGHVADPHFAFDGNTRSFNLRHGLANCRADVFFMDSITSELLPGGLPPMDQLA